MEQTAPVNTVAPRTTRIRFSVTVACALAIVACIVAIAVMIATPAKTDSGKLSDDRAAAISVANTLVQGQWTFDKSMVQGTTMPSFRAKVEGVITPKYDVTFQQLAGQIEAAVRGGSVKRTVQVWSTGVAAINADQATVLVVGAYTDFMPKAKGSATYVSTGEVPFRDVLSLVKVNGAWLVDSQAPAEGLPPTAPPTATSGASQ